jgi:hypothetical protein
MTWRTETSYRRVLAFPQVPELLLSATLARLAGRMFSLAIILSALSRFGSPLLTGWIAFASIGPGLIASPFAGAVLDRLQAPRAITLDMLVSAVLLVVLTLADRTGLVDAPLWDRPRKLICLLDSFGRQAAYSGRSARCSWVGCAGENGK